MQSSGRIQEKTCSGPGMMAGHCNDLTHDFKTDLVNSRYHVKSNQGYTLKKAQTLSWNDNQKLVLA